LNAGLARNRAVHGVGALLPVDRFRNKGDAARSQPGSAKSFERGKRATSILAVIIMFEVAGYKANDTTVGTPHH
jgi:hypothetical protein